MAIVPSVQVQDAEKEFRLSPIQNFVGALPPAAIMTSAAAY